MKSTVWALTGALVGVGLLVAAPAFSADEFCPMGGTLIKVEVDKDKALEWGKDRKKVAIADESADTWSVLTLSKTNDAIAIVVKADSVFFGVAGKGGEEVNERVVSRVFGNDLRQLREAVKREMGDLREARVVKIEGSDVQPLSDAAALGVLAKDRDWALTTEKCDGVDVDASALK